VLDSKTFSYYFITAMKCNECAYVSFKVAKKCPLCNAKLTVGNAWPQRVAEGFTLAPFVEEAVGVAGVATAVEEESEILSLGEEGFGGDFGVEGFSDLMETPAETESLGEETLANPTGDFELDLEDAAETLSEQSESITKDEVSEVAPLGTDVGDDLDQFEVEGLGFEDEIGEDFSDNEINLDALITPKEPLGTQTASESTEETNASDLIFDPEEESASSELSVAEDSDPINLEITSEDPELPNFDPEAEVSEGLSESLVEEPLLQIDSEFSSDQEEPEFIDLDNFGETISAPDTTLLDDEVSDDEVMTEQAGLPEVTEQVADDAVEELEELPEIEIELEPEIEIVPEIELEPEIELDIEPAIEAEMPSSEVVKELPSEEDVIESDEVILDPVEEIDDLSMPEVTPVEEKALSNSEDTGRIEDFKFELETDEDWAQKMAESKKPEKPEIESLEFKLELEPDQSAPLKTLDQGAENVEIEDLGLELEDSDEDVPKPPPAV